MAAARSRISDDLRRLIAFKRLNLIETLADEAGRST